MSETSMKRFVVSPLPSSSEQILFRTFVGKICFELESISHWYALKPVFHMQFRSKICVLNENQLDGKKKYMFYCLTEF